MNINKKGTPLCSLTELKSTVLSGALDTTFEALSAVGGAQAERDRIVALIETFAQAYGEDREVALLTVSGRSAPLLWHRVQRRRAIRVCSRPSTHTGTDRSYR